MARLPLLLLVFLLPLLCVAVDVSQCGKTKDCLFSPPGCHIDNCTYFVASYAKDNWTVIELGTTNLAPNTDYIAVGFSDDDVMGDEAVTFCYLPADGASPSVHTAFNYGKSNTASPEDFAESQGANVQMLHAQRYESALYCTFRQRTTPSVQSEFLPLLDNQYTLFVARGHAHNASKISIHSLDPSSPDFPFIAASPLSLAHEFVSASAPAAAPTTSPPPSTTAAPAGWFSPETKRWFVRIHGVLMLPSWLFLVVCAVLSARYLRDHFASSTPCGLKWWFHIHRVLNFTAVLLALLATLLVFVGKDFRWTGPAYWKTMEKNTSPGTLHSLFGTVAMLAALLQVFLALVRCAPESRARPIFNILHKLFGIFAVLAALIAFFFAVNYFLKLWSDASQPLFLYGIYVVGLIVSIIAFEILDRLKTRRPSAKEEIEMSGGGHSTADSYGRRLNQPPMYATSLLFAVCVGGSILVSVLLILQLVL